MMDNLTFLFKKNAWGAFCKFLGGVYFIAAAGCSAEISSKLEAAKINVPPDQASEVAKGGVTVSVEPGTFSDPVGMTVELANDRVEVSTVTSAGGVVLAENVLKDLHFCSELDPSFDRAKVYVHVRITEDQSGRLRFPKFTGQI